jgi:hypothetical protein
MIDKAAVHGYIVRHYADQYSLLMNSYYNESNYNILEDLFSLILSKRIMTDAVFP